MVSAVLGQPVPERVARAIHQRSDGIPLHIEELIAAIENASLTLQSGAMVRNAAVPTRWAARCWPAPGSSPRRPGTSPRRRR